jgi:hypothetical protein
MICDPVEFSSGPAARHANWRAARLYAPTFDILNRLALSKVMFVSLHTEALE